MAITVAMINMKGGVGKTSLAVNLAWELSSLSFQKKVLLVDLDPQFNASQYVLGTEEYARRILKENHPTVFEVFEQNNPSKKRAKLSFDIKKTIISIANSPIGLFDIVPSSLWLSKSLRTFQEGKEELLANSLAALKKEYDFILIDCAPMDSLLTIAAYHTSDSVIVPVKPEFLSTIGLPLLHESMNDFRENHSSSRLTILGIVFTHTSNYHPEEVAAKVEARAVAKRFGWYVFNNEMPYSRSIPKGAREGKPLSSTSYARNAKKRQISRLALEFTERIYAK